ncbi:MAG: 1-acyl-sn-glycerol-3-phosphate acyltransferase [Clostridiales bacterium]|nr:1-acyl-sn-glycerol-3-phosphate acyltransferase [Clostridiales bacterium]
MIRSIFWYVNFIFSVVWHIPHLFHAKKILKRDGQAAFDQYTNRVTRAWAGRRVELSGAKITVIGEENIPKDRNVLFISNHQSDFDIALFMAKIPKPAGFMAKIELAKIPVIKSWMDNIHCVFMDRSDMKQSVKAIMNGISNLKNGYSMVIFPEGTRSKSDRMGEFKAGSFKLATKPQIPIVPVTLNGSYKVLEENHYRITPAEVIVTIHPLIETKGLTKEEQLTLPEKVKAMIQKDLPQ